ncbi:putative cysteine desulfurylase [Aspergillus flavus]|uniref:Cysteine desulfurylase n=1 Tax=Aspergillus flavus (strain ATCC 200026 / FGSC A1120 / IAM 13836 / NRRL 3357 / JCM 12722 / SRRC 167) TaxID=332952 RepID=A0A7U2MKY9_ASPFN|nr:putative cysteine desulfurylase [Aspergillus flavus]
MTVNKSLLHLDTQAVRRQFPGLEKGAVCLNNGSGALVYKGAIERYCRIAVMTERYNAANTSAHSIVRTMSAPHMNLRGLDSKSMVDVKERTAQYAKLASFMNADPDEIGMLRTLTNSLRPNLNTDSEIIVSVLCHEAGNTAWVALAQSLGISIKWWAPEGGIGNNRDPKLSLDTLRPLLSSKTRLVCCGHVSNITGTIEPIKEIAKLVHTIPEALICVDGVAWAPHRPIDVKDLDVDFYVFSWYKVFGPHIAQIYARRKVQKRYLTSLNHYFFDPTALHVRLGLGNSCLELEHAVTPIITHLVDHVGWDAIIAHEELITAEILGYLTANSDLYTVYGCATADAKARVSLISFSVKGLASDKVAEVIHETSNFRIITGDCWSPRTVHDVIGLPDYGILRTSLVHYNTVEEMRAFTQKLDQVVRSMKYETLSS